MYCFLKFSSWFLCIYFIFYGTVLYLSKYSNSFKNYYNIILKCLNSILYWLNYFSCWCVLRPLGCLIPKRKACSLGQMLIFGIPFVPLLHEKLNKCPLETKAGCMGTQLMQNTLFFPFQNDFILFNHILLIL